MSVSIGNSPGHQALPSNNIKNPDDSSIDDAMSADMKEIQNFFCFADLKKLARNLQAENSFKLEDWSIGKIIASIDDNSLNTLDRYNSLLQLYYHSIGLNPTFDTSTDLLHFKVLQENNNQLIKAKALRPLVKNLRILIAVVIDQNNDPKKTRTLNEFVSVQTDYILDILWMMMIMGATNESFIQELSSIEPFFASFLLDTVEKLAEGYFMQVFSLRKLTLLLYKVVDLIVGGDRGLANSKGEVYNETMNDWLNMKEGNTDHELVFQKRDESALVKCDLQDLVDYSYWIQNRYPSYAIPDPAILGFDALTQSSTIEKQCKQFNQYVIPDPTWTVHAQLEASRYAVFDPPLPINEEIIGQAPTSLQEASLAYLKYFSPSASILQLAMETRLKKLDENLVSILGSDFSIKEQNYGRFRDNQSDKSPQLARIRLLYQELYPRLSNHITMLVRLLFYLNVSSTSSFDHSAVTDNLAKDWSTLSEAEKMTELGKRDGLRHKEIITLAISKILIYITKAAKRFHILAFEHVSFLLVDNSAPILILKMLSSWFANPALQKGRKNTDEPDGEEAVIGSAWLSDRPLPKELDFFTVCRSSKSGSVSEEVKHRGAEKKLLSPRNISITKNLVVILQKLTKSKPNRLLALVQWKAQAVLKRMLKCPTRAFKEPILKLLKHQIPYLGKKWRYNNITIISKIYLSVPHRLREEYLCGEGEINPTEAQQIDSNLRDLVTFYNSHLPFVKDGNSEERMSPIMDSYDTWLGEWVHDVDASYIEEEKGYDDDETWVESLVVDEMGENGEMLDENAISDVDKVFSNPYFNMELLEEESLLNSFDNL